jgi:hypothetical protein
MATLASATQLLNRLITARRRAMKAAKTREPRAIYETNGPDPFAERLNA